MIFDAFQLLPQRLFQTRVKTLPPDLLIQPSGNDRSSRGSHFFSSDTHSIRIDDWSKPWRQRGPVLPDRECDFLDCTIKTLKTRDVLGIVEGGAGLGEPLVGESVLKSFDLVGFVEVEAFDLFVFDDWVMLDVL